MKTLVLALLLTGSVNAAVIPDEFVDQAAHYGVGTAAGFGLSYLVGPYSIPIVIAAAFAREVYQHNEIPDGEGSNRDMFYWTMGAVSGYTLFVIK